jgi:hypothetical protein
MYPPSVEALENATEKGKIDPNKIENVPWALFTQCKWYEEEGINPINGLPQVRYNANWTEACPFICMDNCISENCVLWPSIPYDNTKYDTCGILKDGCVDSPDYTEELHDVIRHHQ